MNLDLLNLALLPSSLLDFILSLALSFPSLVLSITALTIFLDFSSLLLTLVLLSLVFSVALSSLTEGLLGLIEPGNISDQLLLNLVVNHLGVILFLGSILVSFYGSDIGSNLGLFRFDLFKLLLVG